MDAPPLFSVENVSFNYGNKPILKNVSMRLKAGCIVALMGGSGSGKTTLLRMIGGQLQPATGCVRVNGQVVHTLDHAGLFAMRRRLGMLFQFGALFTDLSVYENVAFPLREHFALPESIVRDIVILKLHTVGLRGAMHMMPHTLSGGMARRVALARAIALDPLLMLYDEPFAGLDPISLGVIARLIRELNDALGTGSILVTHNIPESLRIVDYVYFLSEGYIVAEGTPQQISHAADPFVRQFVHGEPDGPVPFHTVAAENYETDLGLAPDIRRPKEAQ